MNGVPNDHITTDPSPVAPVLLELPLPVDWVSWDAIKVLRRLHHLGHVAYLVGGCVRDLMLGRYPKDFDVATSARPREVKRAFANSRLIGRRFRLAHVLFARSTIEVATFRRTPGPDPDNREGDRLEDLDAAGGDPEPPGEVAPAGAVGEDMLEFSSGASAGEVDLLIQSDNVFGTPEEDARRRDFTINGLFYDIVDAVVVDWVGGIRDLEARVIRTIGDPEVRFREDPVRMLRAIRFASQLRFEIEQETWEALERVSGDIRRAAPPRILEEMFRTMRAGGAREGFRLMAEAGLLDHFLGELVPFIKGQGGAARACPSVLSVLGAVDQVTRFGVVLPNRLLLSALTLGPVLYWSEEEGLGGAEAVHRRAGELFDALGARLRIPRREREGARLALMGYYKALQVLEAERGLGALSRKSYYPDAVALLGLANLAGVFPAEWLSRLASCGVGGSDAEGVLGVVQEVSGEVAPGSGRRWRGGRSGRRRRGRSRGRGQGEAVQGGGRRRGGEGGTLSAGQERKDST